jgi:ubiquinone/menaquinone biosynthesis C-methylase UbiE
MESLEEQILKSRYNHEELIRKYNWIAPIYDIFALLMESKARKKALEMMNLQDGEKVLEVAIGTGLNLMEIVKRNPNGWVEGVDISPKMLEKARQRLLKLGSRNFKLHLCDCRNLPFENNSFDIVISQYLLDILPVEDFIPVLQEFKRVLRDGGRLILVNMTKGERKINKIYEEIYKLKLPLIAGCRGVISKPFLQKVGFQVLIREFVSQIGFPSEIVMGIKGDGYLKF